METLPKRIHNGQKWTISASGGLGLLQMLSDPGQYRLVVGLDYYKLLSDLGQYLLVVGLDGYKCYQIHQILDNIC